MIKRKLTKKKVNKRVLKRKNPQSKLKIRLNEFIDSKIALYEEYEAIGIIEFLEKEKQLISEFDDYDIKIFIAHGLNHISNLCQQMFELIKKN